MKRREIVAVASLVLAALTFLFGDNIYQQITGDFVFTPLVSTKTAALATAPLVTIQPEVTATALPITSQATATTTILPVGDVSCGSFVDLGNLQSEYGHDLVGWAGVWTGQPRSPTGDSTFRYQFIRGSASLKLCVPEIGVDYWLVTEVQDFGCDDSFEVYINGSGPLYSFTGTHSNKIRSHSFKVPSRYIDSTEIIVNFKNTAADRCGAAGVYNVSVQRNAP